MANKIVGFKLNKGWYTLHTTTSADDVNGLAVKTFNVKEDRLDGVVELGTNIDVRYGCGFNGQAYIEHIKILGKGDK